MLNLHTQQVAVELSPLFTYISIPQTYAMLPHCLDLLLRLFLVFQSGNVDSMLSGLLQIMDG